MILRLLALLSLSAALVGAEPAPVETTPSTPPLATGIPFRLDYNGGRVALKDGETNHLDGGVEAWYEQAHLHGETLEWRQTPIPGTDKPVIDVLRFLPGPAGFAADRVLIDTRECRLPLVGFRGVLTPRSVVATRRPADPADPGHVRWSVVLAKPGFFAGDLQTKTGWIPHAGWADEIELEVIADLGPNGIAQPRFQTIHLLGQQAAVPAERKRCRLDRLRQPLAKPEDLADSPLAAAEFGIQSMGITIAFAADGRFDHSDYGAWTSQYGTPPADLAVRSRSSLGAGK